MSETICTKCNGTGKVMAETIRHGTFEVMCRECNGEKVITEDLLKRRAVGREMKELRIQFHISSREAAAKLGVEWKTWIYAEQGELRDQYGLSDAEFLLEQFKAATQNLHIEITYYVVAKPSANVWEWEDLFSSKDEEEAQRELARYKPGQLHKGKMCLYEMESRTKVVEKCE